MATFLRPLMLLFLYAKLGNVSMTLMVTVAMPVPPGPVATTVSTVDEYVTLGVPLIVPLVEFTLTPLGRLLPELSA